MLESYKIEIWQEKIQEAEQWIESLLTMSIEEYLEQFKDKLSKQMMKQWFLWFTKSENKALKKKRMSFLKKKNEHLYAENIKNKLDYLLTKSMSNRDTYELVRVRKYSYIKDDVVCDVLIVWLEYYDQTIKKYRYSDSLLIDEVKRPWIIKATENRIMKLWEVYYNKV